MPYINKERRSGALEDTNRSLANNVGELNYNLTLELVKYLDSKGLSYQTLNDISGAMTECLAEFRRRVIIPYEEQKIIDNGDVYK